MSRTPEAIAQECAHKLAIDECNYYDPAKIIAAAIREATEQKDREITALKEVAGWAQAVLTGLNVGDLHSGSLLHLKLREVMIEYRKGQDQ